MGLFGPGNAEKQAAYGRAKDSMKALGHVHQMMQSEMGIPAFMEATVTQGMTMALQDIKHAFDMGWSGDPADRDFERAMFKARAFINGTGDHLALGEAAHAYMTGKRA